MIAVTVQEQSQVSEARRRATEIAERHGFGGADAGKVALVATELATNLVKHSPGGEILVGTYEDRESSGVELMALDQGPGMANVAACLADGYSSAGTRGQGLGAVVRQSHFVDIAAWPGIGTAVLARIAPGQASLARAPSGAGWGAVSVPMPGQEVCGDSWTVATDGETLFVADGLGHGPEAAEASVQAVRLFHRFKGHQVPTLLDYVHGGLRATRGAAIAIARLDKADGKIIFSGIGNIAGAFTIDSGLKRMVSMPGTAGHNARKIQAFEYPFAGGLVIMHSDGLQSSWTLERYTNLATFHPALIAAVLYRDLTRRRDDATVLVARW
jgi:anti-sigma regulatory factor (Ser/Thr protein kinase)